MNYDEIEQTDRFKEVIDDVERELDEMLKNEPRGLGFCHLYWKRKKQLLWEKYGIDWHSPAETNSDIIFD